MPKSSYEKKSVLDWKWILVCHGKDVYEKGQLRNIQHIMSVYCGIWKTIFHVVKSTKIHELTGAITTPWTPIRALAWTYWGP